MAKTGPIELKVNTTFNKPEKYISPGEYYVSDQDIVIFTLLGSCISVALYDPYIQLGGLNHFMLPFPQSATEGFLSLSAKYGINAMELLINEILKMGGKKNTLRAKIFGGSTLLDYEKEATYDIPKMNIDFIFNFLKVEKIPVDSYSVGGTRPRKIYLFPKDGKVMMKYGSRHYTGLQKKETRYAHALLEQTKNAGKVILF